jgi:FkbM family methyltransferase
MMFKALRDSLRTFGVYVSRTKSVPFGVDPWVDIASLCPDAAVALDVGGNYGQTVAKLRSVYPDAQIYSFEPVPAIFQALKRATQNDRRVQCLPIALGETEGKIVMTTAEHTGQNTMDVAAKPDWPTQSVDISTLDVFAASRDLSRIDILKMDVEGYEASVLRGGLGLLKSGAVRFVLAEVEFTHNPTQPHGAFFEIADILLPLGYRVAAFYSGGLDGDGWLWGDVLFMLPLGERPVSCSPYS